MGDKRIYRRRRPLRNLLIALLVLLLTLQLLAVGIFLHFRRYIVYTDDGVRLEVPWLEETEEADTSTSPAQ